MFFVCSACDTQKGSIPHLDQKSPIVPGVFNICEIYDICLAYACTFVHPSTTKKTWAHYRAGRQVEYTHLFPNENDLCTSENESDFKYCLKVSGELFEEC